jgi:hypothetical protein
VLDVNVGQSKHGLFTKRPQTLTNDFFTRQVGRDARRPDLRLELAPAGAGRGLRHRRCTGEVCSGLRGALDECDGRRPLRSGVMRQGLVIHGIARAWRRCASRRSISVPAIPCFHHGRGRTRSGRRWMPREPAGTSRRGSARPAACATRLPRAHLASLSGSTVKIRRAARIIRPRCLYRGSLLAQVRCCDLQADASAHQLFLRRLLQAPCVHSESTGQIFR